MESSSDLEEPEPHPALPHEECSICRTIPNRSRGFWKGGEELENTLPPSMARLQIVGEPFYNTDTSSSNQCLVRCPECGTVYAWDFEYEYLAGGSEDDIVLTRLDRHDGEAQVTQALQAVEEHQAWFAREALSRLDVLRDAAVDSREFQQAVSFLFMEGPRRGADISAALPLILAARARAGPDGSVGSTLGTILFCHGTLGWEQLQTLRQALRDAGIAGDPRSLSLLESCENTLRSKDNN